MYLSINKVSKIIKKNQILNQVDFSVKKNSIFGIIGNNGAGKSTLLKIIATVTPTTQGTVTLDEKKVLQEDKSVQRRISYFIDHLPPENDLTGEEYVVIYLTYKGINDIKSILKREWPFSMEAHRHKKIKTYSQGMKQKLGIIAATIGQQELIILDEPHNSLDPRSTIQLREYLKQLISGGSTIILTSHTLTEITTVCDNVLVLEKGNIKGILQNNELENLEQLL
ncbi:ABC multidrug transporter ATPase component (plasmid) [Alkalihalophilus pseudofirmus OF4]|uniref:ABC multidrug transporter ATPase component n=2 Tax=Bacillaceae TaxID=186817 RepID=D3G220_ALKPO|nr:ABC multidrug transporter ATPase component [Alkalihalophilus pseudofirmus OF4]